MNDVKISQALLDFIKQSPSMFHTIASSKQLLEQAGFSYLPESSAWELKSGGKYFTTRNDSSLIAFVIPERMDSYHLQLTAAHSDSPCFKIKANPIIKDAHYTKLNVEGYGGMIDSTWLDKPLGIAGRVLVKQGTTVESRLIQITDNVALIPNVAIHQNREVNKGYAYNKQVDMLPLLSAGVLTEADFQKLIADAAGVEPDALCAQDLFLVNHQEACIWGAAQEFVSSPKLDDLQCAFAALTSLISADQVQSIAVCCIFDNEEVGSNTKQGAMSTFLPDVLGRINDLLGKTNEDLRQALAKSFMVSCDNAHALHPNRPDFYDSENIAYLNEGIVIKEAASQAYTTDAFSRAVFKEVCARAQVSTQLFANRSDLRGGSTLGNLSNIQVSMHAVDCGLPQLAMHSAFETAGVKDTAWAIAALTKFYETQLRITDSSSFELL